MVHNGLSLVQFCSIANSMFCVWPGRHVHSCNDEDTRRLDEDTRRLDEDTRRLAASLLLRSILNFVRENILNLESSGHDINK